MDAENKKYKKTIHACYRGYITQAIIVNLSPLFFVIFQDDYNISFAALGSIVLLNFITQMLTDIAAIRFVEKVGYRVAAVTAHALATVGLLMLGLLPMVLPILPALVISTIIFSVGGGLLEVLVSPIVDSVPGEAKEASMSLLHSFYCWGQVMVVLVTTFLLFIIGNVNWCIIPMLWAILPLYNLIAFLKVPIIPPLSEHERMPIKKLLKSKIFLIALLMMLCAGASELAIAQWASLFTEKALGVSKTAGDCLGPCFFAVTMGIGRTLYGVYGHKVKLIKVMIFSSVLCVVSYVMTALSQNSVISLAGCAICGIAVSLMWPGMLSVVAAKYKSGGAAMFGIMAIFGDIGCSVGPWLVGIVSQMCSGFGSELALRYGVLAATIFPVIMILGLIRFKRLKEE